MKPYNNISLKMSLTVPLQPPVSPPLQSSAFRFHRVAAASRLRNEQIPEDKENGWKSVPSSLPPFVFCLFPTQLRKLGPTVLRNPIRKVQRICFSGFNLSILNSEFYL